MLKGKKQPTGVISTICPKQHYNVIVHENLLEANLLRYNFILY